MTVNTGVQGMLLDKAWDEINALGGSKDIGGYDLGICDTVEKALEIIEALGGMDPKQRASAAATAPAKWDEPVAWEDIAEILCGVDGNGFYEIRARAVAALYARPSSDRPASAPDGTAKAYVERAIASYAGDPADNQFQKGFLAALEIVRDEAFTSPHPRPNGK